MYVWTGLCVCVRSCVCIQWLVCMCAFVCMYTLVCVYVCVCVYVYTGLYVCVRLCATTMKETKGFNNSQSKSHTNMKTVLCLYSWDILETRLYCTKTCQSEICWLLSPCIRSYQQLNCLLSCWGEIFYLVSDICHQDMSHFPPISFH